MPGLLPSVLPASCRAALSFAGMLRRLSRSHGAELTAWLTMALAIPPLNAGDEVERFRYLLGTQAIGGRYHFTQDDPLVESAKVIRDLGATAMKFALKHEGAKHPPNWTLAELARSDTAYRAVLDMPFTDFLMWANPYDQAGDSRWGMGLSEEHRQQEYRQLYDLTVHLLKTYQGSGKAFYLGHWEGDNMLRSSIKASADAEVTEVRVAGFTEWLRVRQRAVDEAKRDTPHHEVEVWHYTEVNHPTISFKEERPTIANRVLPNVAVDFVSYSAYDSQNDPALLKATLGYIESKMPPKPGIVGKRVFIGEYGFKTQDNGKISNTPAEQNARCLPVIQAALKWGCPFVLYWELYNNEIDDQKQHRGFWLIDDKGVKQPIYETHRAYYQWAREWVSQELKQTGKVPPAEQFRQAALEWMRLRNTKQ